MAGFIAKYDGNNNRNSYGRSEEIINKGTSAGNRYAYRRPEWNAGSEVLYDELVILERARRAREEVGWDDAGRTKVRSGPVGYALYLTWPPNPASLNEIALSTDSIYSMEEKMANLLKALNFVGIATRCSGDGETRVKYGKMYGERPWIEIDHTRENVRAMQFLVDAFNQQSRVKWIVGRRAVIPAERLPPLWGCPVSVVPEGFSLKEMQESAQELGRFAFEWGKRTMESGKGLDLKALLRELTGTQRGGVLHPDLLGYARGE